MQSLNHMDEVNRSVNDRLELLLKMESPTPSAPHTVRPRASSRLIYSDTKGLEIQTS